MKFDKNTLKLRSLASLRAPMTGDTADTTATAANAPLAAAAVETAGKCVLLWPLTSARPAFTAVQGGVQPPSRPF